MLLKGKWEKAGAPPSPQPRSPSKTNSGTWLLGKPASSPIATGSDWTRVGGETISISINRVHPLHAYHCRAHFTKSGHMVPEVCIQVLSKSSSYGSLHI